MNFGIFQESDFLCLQAVYIAVLIYIRVTLIRNVNVTGRCSDHTLLRKNEMREQVGQQSHTIYLAAFMLTRLI